MFPGVSTFIGIAWIDMASDVGSAATFHAGIPLLPRDPAGFQIEIGTSPVESAEDRYRIVAAAHSRYWQFADLVA